MKKRIIRITIFVLLFIITFGVKAEIKYDIKGVNSNVELYNNAVKEMESLNCNGQLYSQATVDKCNNLELRKTNALAYIYNAREYDKSIVSKEGYKLIEDNDGSCSTVFSSSIQDLINKVFLLFYIAGPILLILFGSLDLTKAIVAGDEKKRKALYVKFMKRTIALFLLFASPAIVNLIVNIMGSEKYSKQVYACSFTEKKITISYTYIPKMTGGPSGGNFGASTGSSVVSLSSESDRDAGEYVIVNNSFPGSVKGFSDLVINNGVCQTSTGLNKACISSTKAPNGWGDCCAGIAQIQACGYKKGISLTQKNSGLIVGNSGCNSPKNDLGCSGVWTWNDSTCFATETEYVRFVIENIQNGTPVFTLAGTSSRHFITIVGFKEGTNGTSHEDLLLIDSWDGRLETFKKRKLGKKSNIGNHPCKGHNGEYWASPLKY